MSNLKKIVPLLLLPLLFAFNSKESHVYTVKITPFQDTILPGFANMMEIFIDSVPSMNIGYTIKLDGATMGPSFVRRGLYKVETHEREIVSHATLTMEKDGEEVLHKRFVIPVMTPELKARAEAAIAAQKTN
jgi:hypothetical protein